MNQVEGSWTVHDSRDLDSGHLSVIRLVPMLSKWLFPLEVVSSPPLQVFTLVRDDLEGTWGIMALFFTALSNRELFHPWRDGTDGPVLSCYQV